MMLSIARTMPITVGLAPRSCAAQSGNRNAITSVGPDASAAARRSC